MVRTLLETARQSRRRMRRMRWRSPSPTHVSQNAAQISETRGSIWREGAYDNRKSRLDISSSLFYDTARYFGP